MIYKYRIEKNSDNLNYLVKEVEINLNWKIEYNESKKIVSFMNENFHLDKMAEEYMYMIALDSKCHVNGIFEISHGTVNASLVGIREIFIRLLLSSATSFILLHNHPSGSPNKSFEDIKVTKKIREASEIMGIKILDHIIIGKDCFYSFCEDGCLWWIRESYFPLLKFIFCLLNKYRDMI